AGLEVPMDQALPVRLVERVRDLDPGLEQRLDRKRPALEAGGQCLSIEVLHHQVVHLAFATDVVEHADVWMVERGDGARLALEAGAELGALRQVRRQHLDRHVSAQARVAAVVDLTHSPGAEGHDDLVGTESGAGGQRHGRRLYRNGDGSVTIESPGLAGAPDPPGIPARGELTARWGAPSRPGAVLP